MSERKEEFVTGEIYHCYNRGVDKRAVFISKDYLEYFLKICVLFNTEVAFGGVKESLYNKNSLILSKKLVSIFAYCLNPNHFHLVLRQECDDGISKFMQKIGTGYTMYFNKQEKRSGSLFQGKFKSRYINSDQYLKNVLVYVNRNNELHNINDLSKIRRSHEHYLNTINMVDDLCDVKSALSYFAPGEYQKTHAKIFNFLKHNKEERNVIEFT